MQTRLAFALAVLLSGTAHAALADRDSKFLQTEGQGADYELAIGKLAVQKAAAPTVKSYAQMIVADHDQLNTEMHQLAAAKGVSMPAAMSSKQQGDLQRLQGLSGDAFDRAYKQESVRINGEDKTEDAQELSATDDPDVRSFVQKLQAADSKHYEAGQKL